MKIIITSIIIFIANVLCGQTEDYTDFLAKQKKSSKEYVLQLFDKYDIVIVCERAHPEMTQYDLFIDIISDKKFINKIGTVCTEIGSVSLNKQSAIFINSNFKSEKDRYDSVLNVSRNLSDNALWEKYNYTDFLLRLNRVNEKLDHRQDINLKMVGVPFSWNDIHTREDYIVYDKDVASYRDSLMAVNIMQEYERIKNDKRNKMLVILNYRHAFGAFHYIDGSKPDNTARYIFEKYPDKTANVLINQFAYIKEKSKLEFVKVHNGVWDLAFEETSLYDIGFDFKGTPFGKDKFDMFPYKESDLKYEDVFTGFVFWQPLENHKLLFGIPHIFNDEFREEYKRRMAIIYPNKDIKDSMIRVLDEKNVYNYKTVEFFLKR